MVMMSFRKSLRSFFWAALVVVTAGVFMASASAQEEGEIAVMADQPAPVEGDATFHDGDVSVTEQEPVEAVPAATEAVDDSAINDTADAAAPSEDSVAADATDTLDAAPPSDETLAQTVTETLSDDTAADPVEAGNIEENVRQQVAVHRPEIDPTKMRSLLFNQWEHDLMIQARAGLFVRPPEAPITEPDSPAIAVPGAPGPRELALSGIMYTSKDSWTFWLNGMRITPTGIPEQIMNLKVARDHIEIEWLDTQTNQIYPIRLRPHQRFNLDSRIFLPGELSSGT